MLVKVRNEKISFSIDLTSKYTFLCGDSGIGKSTFIETLLEETSIIESEFKLVHLSDALENKEQYLTFMNMFIKDSGKSVLFYADEDLKYLQDRNFQLSTIFSRGAFLLIGRRPLTLIPKEQSTFYTFENKGQHHEAMPIQIQKGAEYPCSLLY